MRTQPKFIKVHDLADPDVVYTINSDHIKYYCRLHSPDGLSAYTFIALNDDVTIKVTETEDELDNMLDIL